MGGINLSNFRRIKETKVQGIGFNNLINNSEIKKPALSFIKGRA
jgi:hypothetical protein